MRKVEREIEDREFRRSADAHRSTASTTAATEHQPLFWLSMRCTSFVQLTLPFTCGRTERP